MYSESIPQEGKEDSIAMTNKKKKYRSPIPAWVDTLILWLEIIGLIGTVLAGIYALVTLF